nr:MAG TPA: hypothetical protein [Caudoviricetes sp.]
MPLFCLPSRAVVLAVIFCSSAIRSERSALGLSYELRSLFVAYSAIFIVEPADVNT